jgi:hypothetical protein
MRSLKNIVLSLSLWFVLLSGSLAAQSTPMLKLNADEVAWKRISYAAKKFLGTMTTEIRLANLTAEEVKPLFIPVPGGGALQSTASQLFLIDGHSVVNSLWNSVDVLKAQAWYDPVNGAVLQRIRSRQGKEIWQKTYRFTNQGVFRERRKPGRPDEMDGSPARWSNIRESFYPYALSSAGCSHALEPLVLLYAVSVFDWASRDEMFRICVFNKKQLHEVQIRKAGIKPLEIDYTEKSKAGELPRKGEIEAVKFSIKTRSLAGQDQKAEPFSFLGLKGDFDIYIERTSKIPVQISGQITGFGKVNIRLQQIDLRK